MQDKKVMEFETFSPEETLELGRKFGREAQPGDSGRLCLPPTARC